MLCKWPISGQNIVTWCYYYLSIVQQLWGRKMKRVVTDSEVLKCRSFRALCRHLYRMRLNLLPLRPLVEILIVVMLVVINFRQPLVNLKLRVIIAFHWAPSRVSTIHHPSVFGSSLIVRQSCLYREMSSSILLQVLQTSCCHGGVLSNSSYFINRRYKLLSEFCILRSNFEDHTALTE